MFTWRNIKRLALGIVFALVVIGFIPMTAKYYWLTRQSSKLNDIFHQNAALEKIKAYPCMKKFTGVIIEGDLGSTQDIKQIESILQDFKVKDAQLIVRVNGELLEKNISIQ